MRRLRWLFLGATLAGWTAIAAVRAEEPTPVETPRASLGAPIPLEAEPDPETITPRFSLRREFGDGVGYDGGYTYYETFLPLWQTPGQSIAAGTSASSTTTTNATGKPRSAAARAVNRLPIHVVGVNAFYDGRNTDVRYYNQAGFGLELLRRNWELRSNVYLPRRMHAPILRSATPASSIRNS